MTQKMHSSFKTTANLQATGSYVQENAAREVDDLHGASDSKAARLEEPQHSVKAASKKSGLEYVLIDETTETNQSERT